MDMQELIDEQMRSKLSTNKKKLAVQQAAAASSIPLSKRVSSYKLWSLFQR